MLEHCRFGQESVDLYLFFIYAKYLWTISLITFRNTFWKGKLWNGNVSKQCCFLPQTSLTHSQMFFITRICLYVK